MSSVLIADDNPVNLSALAAALKRSGHEPFQAANGKEALELALKHPPDLIISDIMMPVMDGYELCMKWKANERLRGIPFIFYTATYTDPKDKEYGLSLGAERFLLKPAKIETLRKVVLEVLEESRNGALASLPRAGEQEQLRGYDEVIFRKLQQKVVQLEAEVAARKAAEQALGLAAKEVKEKNRELRDFLYISSHDLSGPLVNIQGFTDNIKKYCAELSGLLKSDGKAGGRLEELLDRELPEALGYVAAGVADIDRLLFGLLRMSRVWSVPLAPEPVDMDKLADELLKSMTFHFADAGAEVSCGKLPPCYADKEQLRQVLFNLLDNAAKYRDPARKLAIRLSGEAAASGEVSYTVTDTGLGLTPAEAQGKVWELFYRGGQKARVQGEGVGLTISKRVVERHGGSITAAAAPGGGAVFTMTLPGVKLE